MIAEPVPGLLRRFAYRNDGPLRLPLDPDRIPLRFMRPGMWRGGERDAYELNR